MCNKKNAYPRWYGIPGLEFIWHGAWNDPEIRVHTCKEQREHGCKIGAVFNSVIVEESMVEEYEEYLKDNNLTDNNHDNFDKYMKENVYSVWDHVYLALGGTW